MTQGTKLRAQASRAVREAEGELPLRVSVDLEVAEGRYMEQESTCLGVLEGWGSRLWSVHASGSMEV